MASIKELTRELVKGEAPGVFLAGSFLSTLYPAYLPTANTILKVAVNALSPQDATEEEKSAIVESVLPESYYGLAVELLGSEAMSLWSVLDYAEGEGRN